MRRALCAEALAPMPAELDCRRVRDCWRPIRFRPVRQFCHPASPAPDQ